MSRNALALALLAVLLGVSDGGAQTHLTGVVHQDGTLLAATFGKGVIRSEDGGLTWTASTLPAEVMRVLAVATTSAGEIVVGTEQYGVWRSNDFGESWARWSSGLPNFVTVESLFVDTTHTTWAGTTDHGLYQRASGDSAWRLTTGWRSDKAVSVLAGVDHTLFAGTCGDGLYSSSDAGRTWTRCPGIPEAMNVVAWAAGPDTSRLLVADSDGRIFEAAYQHQPPLAWKELGILEFRGSLYQLELREDGSILSSSSAGVFVREPDAHSWKELPSAGRELTGRVLWKSDPNRVSVLEGRPSTIDAR
jgi:photosystem II stability/assembly factor-like uncharacterized protein